MDRVFPIESGAQVITCGHCGRKDEAGRHGGSGGGKLPGEAIRKWFTSRGWRVGAVPRKDRCPECLKPQRKEPPQMAADTKIIEIRSPSPGASEQPPRQMGREDRQIVFAKLSEVYLGETVGYAAGWHDEAVAKDLNCPRRWVEDTREAFFGPIKADQSAEVQGIKLAIDEVEATLEKANSSLAALTREHNVLADEQKALLSVISGATTLLQKARGELAKLTGRP